MNDPMKTRREFLKMVGFGATAVAISGLDGCRSSRPLNIAIIFTDDQGYADVGCFGAQGFATPNLDRMAAEGMRFTSFYVSQAVCSASRASLLTGCYSERVSIQGALGPRARIGLNPEEETIAELVKKRGYATAIFGKWHLGHHREFLPLQHGFDEYFGLPYSNDMWPFNYDGTPAGQGAKSAHPPLPLIEGNEKVGEIRSLEDQDKLTTLYTEHAVRFIKKNKNRPFFLYVPHSMVHVPLGVSEKFRGKSVQGKYGDVVMEIDWSVGEILQALDRYGLDDRTLVIFTSDNGPWLNFGNHAGSALPLREGKGTMWEGGARVPCIMRWPGRIPAGRECRKIAATIDLLPTIAAVTGAPLPEKPIDGINILSLLAEREGAEPRDHYFYYYGQELQAVRQGKWKLHFPHKYRSYVGVQPGRDGNPGPYASGRTGLELYDLEQDIGETKDEAARYPDVVERLKALAETARQELGDSLTMTKGRGVRPPGRISGQRIPRVDHLGVGKKITLMSPYHNKYSGGGDGALIDGIRGTDDYQDGAWQGFEGVDFKAVVDLGGLFPVRRIAVGFLSDQTPWIFLPTLVEIALSKDGASYDVVKRIPIDLKRDPAPAVKDFDALFAPSAPVRYVRIDAKNIGRCPAWHPGAGGRAWLFIDEIIIEA